MRLQQHVAEGKIKPDDLAIYFINPTPGGKQAIKLEMNDSGQFLTDWPGGFFPERLQEATKLAQIRGRKAKLSTAPNSATETKSAVSKKFKD
jgi:predicted ATPase